MGQKFFALTSAARRVAFECDFDLSFAASRDKSPRLLSKRVVKTERERGRWEDKFFFNFDLHLRFHFRCTSAKQAAGKGAAVPSVAAWRPLVADHWFPACLFLSPSLSLFPSLSLLQVGDVHKRILKFMKQQQPQQRWQQQRAASESAATKRTF